MLSLKNPNPFANTTQATSPRAAVLAAEASLKGKQLLRGKTKARVESLTAQVEDARKILADAKQTLGARMGDGEDVTSITRTVRQAHDHLDAVEAALAVAIQKDESAQAALRDAEQQENMEKAVEVTAQLKTAFLEMDQLLLALERLTVDKINPALDTARLVLGESGVRDGELYFLAEAPSVCKQQLLLAVCTLIKEGFVPSNLRKYQRVSDCIPDEAFIRSRPRPGPSTAKPIPGWGAGS